MAKRGYTQKRRSFSKSSSGRSSGGYKRTSRSAKRSGTSRPRAVAPQTIRIVFAQEPGGAAVANPALPIPPSMVTEKTRKAKL